MKGFFIYLFGFYTLSFAGYAQQRNFTEDSLHINKFIEGNLVMPLDVKHPNLVIFIQGSGQTNRDGNQNGMQSDYAKKIAYELAAHNIASFRFDKRSIKAAELNLDNISFDDFVSDVKDILTYFRAKDSYNNLVIAGHSQGSLVGMLAAKDNADGFISLAGPGKSIDHILVDQLSAQLPQLKEELETSMSEIKKNGSTTEYPKIFENIFHPSNQPFLASWMKYDPSKEIKKLKMPTLIINGTRDLQVNEQQAEILHDAAAGSKLVLLKDMNHVFREIKEEEKNQNFASYANPQKPLHPELIPVLINFIKNLERK